MRPTTKNLPVNPARTTPQVHVKNRSVHNSNGTQSEKLETFTTHEKFINFSTLLTLRVENALLAICKQSGTRKFKEPWMRMGEERRRVTGEWIPRQTPII